MQTRAATNDYFDNRLRFYKKLILRQASKDTWKLNFFLPHEAKVMPSEDNLMYILKG